MGGLCNVDENDFRERGFQGLSFRTFNVETRPVGASTGSAAPRGALQDPVFGRFENGIGLFHGEDVDGDRPVKVVYPLGGHHLGLRALEPGLLVRRAGPGRPTGSWTSPAPPRRR